MSDAFSAPIEMTFFFKDFIYLLFREGGREGEREGEKHQCVRETLISCLSHSPSWGPGMCPDWELNW